MWTYYGDAGNFTLLRTLLFTARFLPVLAFRGSVILRPMLSARPPGAATAARESPSAKPFSGCICFLSTPVSLCFLFFYWWGKAYPTAADAPPADAAEPNIEKATRGADFYLMGAAKAKKAGFFCSGVLECHQPNKNHISLGNLDDLLCSCAVFTD